MSDQEKYREEAFKKDGTVQRYTSWYECFDPEEDGELVYYLAYAELEAKVSELNKDVQLNRHARVGWKKEHDRISQEHFELEAKVDMIEAENNRLRALSEIKAESQSTIRVEIPSKENGYCFYVTSLKANDEERLALLMQDTMGLFGEYMKEAQK